jgi:hypothetical protein
MKPVQLAYYQHRERNAPLAVVRYTLFDIDDKVVDVQQFEYPNTKEGKEEFEYQVVTALESDVDAAVLSSKNIKEFGNLHGFLQSIGYYFSRDPKDDA